VFCIAPPGRLDESNWNAKRLLRSAALQDIIEVVFVAVAILPSHFALAASRGAWSLEIEVETVSLRRFAENVADERFKTIPDDLAPAMGERLSHDSFVS
jgi:hypothetical protein